MKISFVKEEMFGRYMLLPINFKREYHLYYEEIERKI
jgi:hypothetical protein